MSAEESQSDGQESATASTDSTESEDNGEVALAADADTEPFVRVEQPIDVRR